MFRKFILSIAVLVALIGAGFGLAYKDEASTALRTAKYHSAMDAGDYASAYTLANQMAADGYMPAHGFLAGLYENGTGVTQNMTIAVAQYKLAATAGDAPAQMHLAGLYMRGIGVKRNEKLAVHWYEKSAKNGSPTAQFELGRLYQNGTIKTEDPTKARALLLSASEQGIWEANTILADMASLDLGLR